MVNTYGGVGGKVGLSTDGGGGGGVVWVECVMSVPHAANQ